VLYDCLPLARVDISTFIFKHWFWGVGLKVLAFACLTEKSELIQKHIQMIRCQQILSTFCILSGLILPLQVKAPASGIPCAGTMHPKGPNGEGKVELDTIKTTLYKALLVQNGVLPSGFGLSCRWWLDLNPTPEPAAPYWSLDLSLTLLVYTVTKAAIIWRALWRLISEILYWPYVEHRCWWTQICIKQCSEKKTQGKKHFPHQTHSRLRHVP
jgi:hypothetical protein